MHPNQQLFQVWIYANWSLHLFVWCTLRTPLFYCLCWTARLDPASSWLCPWQWRQAPEPNGAFISFLEKVLLMFWRGSKGDKTIGKNTEALWRQYQNSQCLQRGQGSKPQSNACLFKCPPTQQGEFHWRALSSCKWNCFLQEQGHIKTLGPCGCIF